MLSINNFILEKLKVNSNTHIHINKKSHYNYFPQDKQELIELIKERDNNADLLVSGRQYDTYV